MYCALHIRILKKFGDNEKHLNENVDGDVQIDEKGVKDDKKQDTILTDWNENIVIVFSMIRFKK